jgi:predicted helicase
MKVGLKLSETGYNFRSEERARIYLTNALEPARDLDMEFIFMSEALAHEAQGANYAKGNTPFTAVIGNPPYGPSNEALNPTKLKNGKPNWIGNLLDDYMQFDGVRISERNPKSVKSDELKFIRIAQYFINRSQYGVFSYINPHGYFDAVVARGLRQSLRRDFEKVYFINLNGNANRGLAAGDQNVFDIKQGVAINTFLRRGDNDRSIAFADLVGPREGEFDAKYETLMRAQHSNIGYIELSAGSFDKGTAKILDHLGEYEFYTPITSVFISNDNGFKSHRDQFAVALTEAEINSRLADFLNPSTKDEELKEKYLLEDNRDWSVSTARSRAAVRAKKGSIDRVSMFPFDLRFSLLDTCFMDFPRGEVLRSAYLGPSLVTSRQTKDMWDAKAFKEPINHKVLAKYDTNYLFPLWLNPAFGERQRRPNIERAWALALGRAISLNYLEDISLDINPNTSSKYVDENKTIIGEVISGSNGRGDLIRTFGPRDIFDYVYAVLHSPNYRSRYIDLLKSDFPRVPAPGTRAAFAALVNYGRQLVGLHLLETDEVPILNLPEIRFAGTGENRIEKGYPRYDNGKVIINATRWFEDVPKATWEFHVGGYQVCEKWLKDRAGKGGKNPSTGRVLTDEDILHYRRIVVALTETRRLMAEIDVEIDKHGGWPDAFVTEEGAD